MLKFFLFKFTLNHFPFQFPLLTSGVFFLLPPYPLRGLPLILWGLPLTSLILLFHCILRSCSTVSPICIYHYAYGVSADPTISYGVPLYPIIFTVPISWIIHVFHALIYNVIFIFSPLENRFNARLEIRSLGKSSPLHHRNRTWKIYIFWGGI